MPRASYTQAQVVGDSVSDSFYYFDFVGWPGGKGGSEFLVTAPVLPWLVRNCIW